jgi:hypothetical protein
LRPEMNTTVRFLANESPAGKSAEAAGVFVPANALRDVNGGKAVFIAFDGKAVMRQVKIVATRSGGVLVSGLVGGENVIISGPPDLKDGEKIRIKGQS